MVAKEQRKAARMKANQIRYWKKKARAKIVSFRDAILAMEAQMQLARLRKAV